MCDIVLIFEDQRVCHRKETTLNKTQRNISGFILRIVRILVRIKYKRRSEKKWKTFVWYEVIRSVFLWKVTVALGLKIFVKDHEYKRIHYISTAL